jgi:hypothetical protein
MTNAFFTNKTTVGSSAVFTAGGQTVTVLATGTFGTGVLKLEISPDDGTTWISLGQLTASGKLSDTSGRGTQYRLTLATPDGTTSVSAWVAFEC